MIIKALNASSWILNRLNHSSGHGKVHSVFSRTANLLLDDCVWVSLHPAGFPLHPHSVILDGADCRSFGDRCFLGVRPREGVRLTRSVIEIGQGKVVIELSSAAQWDPGLVPRQAPGDRKLNEWLEALWYLVGDGQFESPFLAELAGRDDMEHSLRCTCRNAVDGLSRAWRARSTSRVMYEARKVIGLGPGLTPSGDDFLVGLLASAHYLAHYDEFRQRVCESLRSIVAFTTLPSAFMLKAALDGMYPEPLHALLDSLDCGNNADLRTAWERLRNIGATSGQDMVAGVIFWLQISMTWVGFCEEDIN